ncbi:MAG: hypothetical protein QOG80_442 [Pseudonocardiales bacterium]|jgi:uncharacterized protein (TIGR03086 family)|nr:hypothetical protein [Pseudonocardiales bacterium]
MDNVLHLFDESVRLFDTQVQAVGSGDWDKPTPDTEWNVAALVKHLIDEHLWMPPLLGGHDLGTAEKIVAGASTSGDPAADWATASTASRQSVFEPGALERTVALSRGPTPAAEYLVEMTFDAAVHAWDLGTAVGREVTMSDELVGFLYPMFVGMQDEVAATGLFAPPVQIADDAPLCDKLLAATGRTPH